MDIYTFDFLFLFAFTYLLDLLSIFIHPFICAPHLRYNSVSESERWFFIHIINNIFVIYTTYNELVICTHNIYTCDTIDMMDITKRALTMAKVTHLYHLAFFKKISYETLLHHIVMCIICGPIVYLFNNTSISASLMFFLSGLPGFLDYINLYLVKLGYISPKSQKLMYLFISLCIRCPGILFFSILQLLYNNGQTTLQYVMKDFLAIASIWNSQYFMYLTIKDCIQKNVLVKKNSNI
tara:strand:- start:119 stop:832 length:714 start_codon:yes stop_codon:yes gene_type:complete